MATLLIILCAFVGTIDAVLRIFGGTDVEPGKYPYVIQILAHFIKKHDNIDIQLYLFICTGSVITPIWTLTAGHCIHDASKTLLPPGIEFVKLVINGSREIFDIVDCVKHPQYKQIRNSVAFNDVALVKTKPIELPRYGKLSGADYVSLAGQAAVVAGYGLMHIGDKVGDAEALDKPLQVLDVVVKTCAKEDIKLHHHGAPILCLSRRCGQPVAAVCPGDSGGALIHHSGLVAVTHSTILTDCVLKNAKAGISSNYVGFFTPISPYLNWIGDRIRKG